MNLTIQLLVVLVIIGQSWAYFDAIVVDADTEGREDADEDYEEDREVCHLPRAPGPCRGLFTSYYFNPRTERCEQFVWSGCGGNGNRFSSLKKCEDRCADKQDEGSDDTANQNTVYSSVECPNAVSRCDTKRQCRMTRDRNNCPVCDCKQRQLTCGLPAQRGHCRALLPRWRYDVTSGTCRMFHFGGCDGNGNNFASEKQCMQMCKGVTTVA